MDRGAVEARGAGMGEQISSSRGGMEPIVSPAAGTAADPLMLLVVRSEAVVCEHPLDGRDKADPTVARGTSVAR